MSTSMISEEWIIYQKFNKKAVAPSLFHSSEPDELITKLEFKAFGLYGMGKK